MVTHLMGADVWDFLLKCTALTQKCEALASKDIDFAEYITSIVMTHACI